MKKILLFINLVLYCAIMLFLVIFFTAFAVPIFLIAVAIQLLALVVQTVWYGDIPDNFSWSEAPNALSELICKLGLAFDIDLLRILSKLAKK